MANDAPPNDWRPNPGRRPDDVDILHPDTGAIIGTHRVHVRLFNGWTSAGGDAWPADRGTVWTIDRRPHPFNIREYRISE